MPALLKGQQLLTSVMEISLYFKQQLCALRWGTGNQASTEFALLKIQVLTTTVNVIT